MKAENLEDIYQLSPMQKGMLFFTLYAPESGVYFNQVVWRIGGPLKIQWFEEAWRRVIQRHPILRTAFYWEELDEPVQVVYKEVALPLRTLNWQQLTPDEQQAKLDQLLLAEEKKGFKLTQAPLSRLILIRITPELYWFVWNRHHILLDGWAQAIVLREIFTLYQWAQHWRRSDYDDITLLGPAQPYGRYIEWLQQQDLTEAAHFWQQHLQGITEPTPLRPGWEFVQLPAQKRTFQEAGFHLDSETTAALQTCLQQHQITLSTLIQAIWGLLLHYYSGQTDILFGVTVSGRPTTLKNVTAMVGLFINTLPARLHIDKTATWQNWLPKLQNTLLNLNQYQFTPLAEIHGWSQVPRTLPLFDSVVVIENYPMDTTQLQKEFALDVSLLRATMSRNNLPLTVRVVPNKALHLQLMYDQARFTKNEVQRMLTHFEEILKQTAVYIEQPLHTSLNRLTTIDKETQTQKTQAFKAASLQKLKKVRRQTAVE